MQSLWDREGNFSDWKTIWQWCLKYDADLLSKAWPHIAMGTLAPIIREKLFVNQSKIWFSKGDSNVYPTAINSMYKAFCKVKCTRSPPVVPVLAIINLPDRHLANKGSYLLWANCFMCWMPTSNAGPRVSATSPSTAVSSVLTIWYQINNNTTSYTYNTHTHTPTYIYIYIAYLS